MTKRQSLTYTEGALTMPRRTANPFWSPATSSSSDLFDAQREVHLLRVRLANEQAALATWQRRLAARTAWEATHSGPTELLHLRPPVGAADHAADGEHEDVVQLVDHVTRPRVGHVE